VAVRAPGCRLGIDDLAASATMGVGVTKTYTVGDMVQGLYDWSKRVWAMALRRGYRIATSLTSPTLSAHHARGHAQTAMEPLPLANRGGPQRPRGRRADSTRLCVFSGGNVSYTHDGGIDRALVITKNDVSVIPHQNWRGQFTLGTWRREQQHRPPQE
jgi:hypothetical protein